MGKLKAKKVKKSRGRGTSGGGVARVASSLGSIVSAATATRGGGGGRRRRTKSPSYWANKVLVAKLKKRYYKIQYGGMR